MVGAPMDDRGHRQHIQPVGGGLHGAHAQADLLAAALESAQARAVGAGAGGVPDRAQRHVMAEATADHRQARRTAVHRVDLAHEREAALETRRRLGDLRAVLGDGQTRIGGVMRGRTVGGGRGLSVAQCVERDPLLDPACERRVRFDQPVEVGRLEPQQHDRFLRAHRGGARRALDQRQLAERITRVQRSHTAAVDPHAEPAALNDVHRVGFITLRERHFALGEAAIRERGGELGKRRAVERGEVRVHAQEVAERARVGLNREALAQRRVELDGGQEHAAVQAHHDQRARGADRCRSWLVFQQRRFAERVAGAEPVERDLLAVLVLDQHPSRALGDHVVGVGRLALADDGVAESERDGDERARDQRPDVALEPVQQREARGQRLRQGHDGELVRRRGGRAPRREARGWRARAARRPRPAAASWP